MKFLPLNCYEKQRVCFKKIFYLYIRFLQTRFSVYAASFFPFIKSIIHL